MTLEGTTVGDHNADYDYNQHRADLTGEHGKNYVQPLSGYDAALDMQPDPNWPGLDPDPSRMMLDRTALEGVLAELKGLLASVHGASGFTQITQLAAEARFGPDQWQAAKFLKDAANQVSKGLGDYGAQLVANLEGAIAAIQQAADSITTADGAARQGITAVGANLAGPGAGAAQPGTGAGPVNFN
jgi:hypothetical protein